jgi:hypothetical protein
MTADPDVLALLGTTQSRAVDPTVRNRKANICAEAARLARKLVKLKTEGLQLYNPLPLADRVHQCTAQWRILDGSNRSAKTLSSAAEAARCFCGCDPYDKYVKTNGNALLVGLKEEHIALMWRKMTAEGQFKIVRDEHTRQWRSVRPNPNDSTELDPYDLAYREKWKDAPPLIPPRMIRSVAYEAKNKGIPRMVTFSTGWRLNTRSANGQPDQGDHYNLVWFDEEMDNAEFYKEAVRGLVGIDEPPQHLPKAIWSATSQVANAELAELRERAESGSPDVACFRFLIEGNPYIPATERRKFWESLSPDERQTRYYGVPALVGRRIYPTYDPAGLHGCDPFEIPPTWCKYATVDPGRQHCATTFYAVDPNEEYVYLYDGFDLKNADAMAWAGEVRARGTQWRAMVIDQQMGKQHPPGAGKNVAEQYWEALTIAGIEVDQQGELAGFFPGTNDVRAREEALLSWLGIRGVGPFEGKCKLQVMRGSLPDALHKQIKQARMKLRDPSKREKLEEDLLVTLEYTAAFDPRYYEPRIEKKSPDDSLFDRFLEKKRRRHGRVHVLV